MQVSKVKVNNCEFNLVAILFHFNTPSPRYYLVDLISSSERSSKIDPITIVICFLSPKNKQDMFKVKLDGFDHIFDNDQ